MAALFDLNSLRGKITSAYAALVAGAIVLGVIAFLDLLFLGRQVSQGEVVSDLKDAVLEMRREEKNLFLYTDNEALLKADQHALSSLHIVQASAATLGKIMRRADAAAMTANLEQYRLRLEAWNSSPADGRQPLEEQIRTLGHQIYLTAESLSQEERRMLETAVQKSQWFLLLSLSIIGLAIYLVGRQLKHVAVTPLKKLESRLLSIARGDFNQLEPPSLDREFLTFTDAFNRMLKELQIRQKRMLQSEKLASLGILASGVAHELNNPLGNISTSCQLLLEELGEARPEQLETWLRQIDSETERGKGIVRTLLDFGSQRAFEKQRVKLLELVNETLTIIGKTLRQNAAELSVNIPADLTLEADRQRIQQLFINLVQNSLHATGKGGHVRISAMFCQRGVATLPNDAEVAGNLKCIGDYDGGFVEILVVDDGPGIPTQQLSKVFDPFFTTSDPGQGVGLGLYIVQEIVREHDGCLAIASRPGKGTQVTVLLPGEELSHE
jgi:two-component system, NtrC family, sensor kinase